MLKKFLLALAISVFSLPLSAATVDLVSGPYTNCPGSGCAKGDYRNGSDATVSTNSWTLTTPTGSFTSADVGKRGVAMDWAAGNGSTSPGGTCWSGYACYQGRSCQFTVSSINSSTSINVSAVAGCGTSGIGFAASGTSYWSVYTDDSTAVHNAITAASGGTLTVPSSYKGGIYSGTTVPANTTISCSTGATFVDPKLNTSTTYMFQPNGAHVTFDGCTLQGTEPSNGAYYDVTREYNIFIGVFGVDSFTFKNGTVKDGWGTYNIGSSGATNFRVTNTFFSNCGMYAVQLNNTGGTNPETHVDHNTFANCMVGSEDGSLVAGTPNANQLVEYNYMYVTSQGGDGYYRTQTAQNLANSGAAELNAGVAASGRTPGANEYSGVTYSNNYICGKKTYLQPCPSGQSCGYHTFYGSTVTSNTCTNGCNGTTSTSTCSVSVSGFGATSGTTPAPTITSFSASPSTINAGSSSTLSWATTGTVTSMSISPSPGTVTGTSTTVSPTANTTYTLTVTGPGGTTTATVIVHVNPTISSFTASPVSIGYGSSSTLSWSTIGATSLSISPGVGTVTGTSTTVSPTSTTIYTLTATNSNGTASSTVTVKVTPVVVSFTATPASISTGGSSTLAWVVNGATSLSISGIGTVTGSSTSVSPASTTLYTLTATNTDGSDSKTATVTVTGPISLGSQSVTSTQAVINYTAPDANACNVVVTDSNGVTAYDTDETLFPGSSLDSRAGSITFGRSRQFVVGARTASLASDGTMKSRALAADSAYKGVITCGSTTANFSFKTNTVPLGDTAPNPFPYDSNAFGNFAFPTIDLSDASKTYVDPQTGTVLKRITDAGYVVSGTHSTPWIYVYDLNSAWSNEAALQAGTGSATYTGTGGTNAKLFIPFHLQDGNRGAMFYETTGIDDVQLNVTAGSSIASDSLSACLTVGGSNQCIGNTITIPIAQGTPASASGPSSYPVNHFHGWGDPVFTEDQNQSDYIDNAGISGRISVSGTKATVASVSPAVTPYTFPFTLASGTKIHIAGSNPTCPGNECTVASSDGVSITLNQNLGTYTGFSTTLSANASGSSISVVDASGFILSQRFQQKVYNFVISGNSIFCTTLSGNNFTGCSRGDGGTISYSSGTAVTAKNYTIENWGILVWPTAGASRTVTISGGNLNYASSGDNTNTADGGVMFCASPDVSVSYQADGTTLIPGGPKTGKMCIIPVNWPDDTEHWGVLIKDTGEFRMLTPLSAGATQDPFDPMVVYETVGSDVEKCTYNSSVGHFATLSKWSGSGNPNFTCDPSPVVTNPVSQISTSYPQIDQTIFVPKFAGKVGKYVGYFLRPAQDTLIWFCAFDITKTAGTELIGCVDAFSHYPMRWGDAHGPVNPFSDNGWFKFFSGVLGNNNSHSGPYKVAIQTVYNNGGFTSITDTFNDPSSCETLGASTQMQALGATGNNCIKVNIPTEPLNPIADAYDRSTTGTPGTKPMAWAHNSPSCSPGGGDGVIPSALGSAFNCSSYLQPLIEGDWLQDGSSAEFFMIVKKTVLGDGTIDLVLLRHASAGNWPTTHVNDSNTFCVGQNTSHGGTNSTTPWFLEPVPVKICNGNVYWINVSDPSFPSSPQWISDDPRGWTTHSVSVYHSDAETLTNTNSGSASFGGYAGAGTYGFGYGIRSGSIPGVYSTVFPQYGVNQNFPFHGDINGIAVIQSHPGWNIEYDANGNRSETILDGRPVGTASGGTITAYNQSVTLVSGKTNTYLMGSVLGAINEDTNIKLKSLLGWYGHTLLKDLSGPTSATTFGDSTPDSYCYAYKAGECVTGSTAGNSYVSVLDANTSGGCKVDMMDRTPCLIPVPRFAFSYTQMDASREDPLGQRQRVVTTYGNGPGHEENYGNHHGGDGSGWLIGWGRYVNGGRSAMLGAKDPRWMADSSNRTDFVKIPLKLSGRTGDTVRIRFGYDTNLYCTSRQEQCSTDPTTTTDPFAFVTADSVTWQSCGASGCTETINAYANRTLYYVVDRKDSNGNVTSSPMQVIAVP